MSRSFRVGLVLVLALVVVTTGAVFAAETPTKQVGVVIAFPDGTEHTEVVTLPQDATTYDALLAAQIDLVSADLGFGPAVCDINGYSGCSADNCFCDPTHFWAYYHLDATTNTWVSAVVGVDGYTPANGAVEGLAWSGFDASFNPTVQPAVHTFDQLAADSGPLPIPEPATLLLVGGGVAGLAGYVRRRRRS